MSLPCDSLHSHDTSTCIRSIALSVAPIRASVTSPPFQVGCPRATNATTPLAMRAQRAISSSVGGVLSNTGGHNKDSLPVSRLSWHGTCIDIGWCR
jgi:hypothetical protein